MKGLSFTFNVESVFLFLLSPPKQTYSIDPGYHWSYCFVRSNMNLYIDFIYKISRWKLMFFANTYIFLCVDSQTLLLWNHYLRELVQYVGHIAFMYLTYYLWKVLLEWFNLVIHCFLAIKFDLHYYLDQVCVGCMSHQKLFVIHNLLYKIPPIEDE